MKTLALLTYLLLSGAQVFAGEAVYCRDVSTPDNSATTINYSGFEIDVVTDGNASFGRELLLSRDLASGQVTTYNSDLKKIQYTEHNDAIDINVDGKAILIVKEASGKLFQHIVAQSCSNHPPYGCVTKLQRLECTKDKNDLANLTYPASQGI